MRLPYASNSTSQPENNPTSATDSTTVQSWVDNFRQQLTGITSPLTSRISQLRGSSPSSTSRNEDGTKEEGEDQIDKTKNESTNKNKKIIKIIKNLKGENKDEQYTDLESGIPPRETASDKIHRFEYDPGSFVERLLVSIRVKNKLDSSRIIKVPFNIIYKYLLLILLLVLTFFLTPQLLPRWLGFEWAGPQDLCQAPEKKLQMLEGIIREEAKLNEAIYFLNRQKFLFECMNNSADHYFYGMDKTPYRFKWPDECTSEKAQTSLLEKHCQSQETNVCSAVGGFFGFLASLGGNCVKQVGPDLCVESTDKDRADSLLKLEQQRARTNLLNENSELNSTLHGTNSTISNVTTKNEPILDTANNKIQSMISRVIQQIDVAADAFILYSIIAIAVGVPLIIYRREKSSMVVSTTFGLTKISFVVVFVLAISLFDSAALVMKETNFTRLFENFLKDPCYVDPSFSKSRVNIISTICNEISTIQSESDIILQRMDSLYYDIRLFGYCKDDKRELSPHPALTEFDDIRTHYQNKTDIGINPGNCNVTRLNERTSTPLDDENSHKWKTLFGSGVIAQLLLKFVLTSFIIHLFAYVQPLVLHNGKVEIWGPVADEKLPATEEYAVKRFARDKHLLSLVVFSILMVFEIILIVYAIITTIAGVHHIDVKDEAPPPIDPNETLDLKCPSSFFE